MKRRDFIKTTAIGNAGMVLTPMILSKAERINRKKFNGKIRIGQIGVSHEHAAPKIEALKKLPDIFDIVGIVDDRSSEAARRVGDSLNPYKGLTWMSEEELFNTPDLQAVLVETANADLVPTAIRCMEHNLAIHMDKPGGEDLELFGKLLNGCKKENLPFQMGYMFRNNPAIQFCQKVINENWLGDIFTIQTSMSHNYGGGEPYQQYLSNFKGGIMFNLGCHFIDLIISMLGKPDKTTPFLGTTIGAPNPSKNNCMAVLEYPNTLVSVYACDLVIDGIEGRYLKIYGSQGKIELKPLERFDGKPLELKLTLATGNKEYVAGTHKIDFGIMENRYKAQLFEFAKIVNEEMKNPYTYEHDYITQEVVLAASGFNL